MTYKYTDLYFNCDYFYTSLSMLLVIIPFYFVLSLFRLHH
ncbi:hypothetical protein HMPREF2534_00001 [Bacteroides thetaiotaomicron]|nr:hypothetical protein HMPREF2534_00001 [Bacteroides thetaiotaomicron]